MVGYGLPLWREDRLLFGVALSTSLLSSWLWWVPVRCVMEGEPFQWANSFGNGVLRGSGMGGDFWVLLLLSTMFIAIVYMGWRSPQGVYRALLPMWCGINLIGTLIIVLDDPSRYRFRGDTMGIDINMAWFMPALKGALVLAVVTWIVREITHPTIRTTPAWTPLNSRFLAPVLVLVPLQILLLRFGPMHDWTDKLGWMLTYLEWVLINLAFLPWIPKGKSPTSSTS